MALARNLNRKKSKITLPPMPKLSKWAIIGIVAASLTIIGFGITFLLPKMFPPKEARTEVNYETGDRPLIQKTSLWVVAEGGLFMRESPDSKSQAVSLIPNGTQLEADENLGEWYKVTYQGKTGWVSKTFVTTQAPAQDPTKDWKTFQNNTVGYTLRYPAAWVAQDYGVNPASESTSYVGFGSQLGASLDTSTLPPVVARATAKSIVDIESFYAKQASVISEAVTVSGIAGKKFIYNSTNGVQMSTVVVSKGSTVYIFEESGGFSEELIKIIGTVVFTG